MIPLIINENKTIWLGIIGSLLIHGLIFIFSGKTFLQHAQFSVQPAVQTVEVSMEEIKGPGVPAHKFLEVHARRQPLSVMASPKGEAISLNRLLRRFAPRNDTNLTTSKDVRLKPFDTNLTTSKDVRLKPFDTNLTTSKDVRLKPFDTNLKTNEAIGPFDVGLKKEAHSISDVRVKANPDYFQNPSPEYPELARQMRQEGLVMLAVDVDRQGGAIKVEILKSSGFRLLDQAAVKAVRHWKFQPGKIGDLPVESNVTVPIRFYLQGLK